MTNVQSLTVGVDGSENSRCALVWAAREARQRGCHLRVVHVYSIPYYGGDFGVGAAYSAVDVDTLRHAHESIVRDELEKIAVDYPDLTIETVVESGWPIGAILERATNSDMITIGSSGTGPMAAVFLGSVAHGIAHRSKHPVVLIPIGPMRERIEHVVVATDGSRPAAAALDWALMEAELWGAELTVVHAWEYPYIGLSRGTAEPVELMQLDAAQVLADAVADLRARRPTSGTTIRARLVLGSTAAAIVDAAATSDLLVVGARGRGALKSALLGSTSSAVIHRAHCPVAVIHATSE
jgi:nucleotide-binding universal stress UspA family protein